MRKFNQGSYVRVTVSASEVANFAHTWPGNNLPNCGISFIFDKSGDLVDIFPEYIDGPDVVALSQDAQKYAGL